MADRRNNPFSSEPAPESAAGEGQPGCSDVVDERLQRLAAERDEARTHWKRALADFQNYQRRAGLNEEEARRQGAIGVLMSVFPVLDHFDIALTQAAPDDASRRIMDGVRVIRDELLRALERHGVTPINPKPNDEFDPTQHQAVIQQAGEGVEPGRISSVMQTGYALEGRPVRSAMVAVSPNA